MIARSEVGVEILKLVQCSYKSKCTSQFRKCYVPHDTMQCVVWSIVCFK